jgi:hypothetical protein
MTRDNVFWKSESMTVIIHEIDAAGASPPYDYYFAIVEKDGGDYCERVVVDKDDLLEFCRYLIKHEDAT